MTLKQLGVGERFSANGSEPLEVVGFEFNGTELKGVLVRIVATSQITTFCPDAVVKPETIDETFSRLVGRLAFDTGLRGVKPVPACR